MKQLIKLTALLLFLFTSAGFVSCSDDDEDGNQSSLVGTWRCDYGEGGYQIITLESDGTGTIFDVEYVNGQVYSDAEDITWSYSNGKMRIKYEDGEVETFTVSISGNAIIVDGEDRYVRVG